MDTPLEQIRENMQIKLPQFRVATQHLDTTPDPRPFLAALEKEGLSPRRYVHLFASPLPERQPEWKLFWEKAQALIEAHTPPALKAAEAALSRMDFPGGNLEILIPSASFRELVSRVMLHGGRGEFRSGETHFWETLRNLNSRGNGPHRIPKGWRKILEGKLPKENPVELIRPHLGKGTGEVGVFCYLLREDTVIRSLQTWYDPEAFFHFNFPDGMGDIHHWGGVREGYRTAMSHGTMPYGYPYRTPLDRKSDPNYWGEFLLTPTRVKMAREFNLLLQEADQQGTDCFYSS